MSRNSEIQELNEFILVLKSFTNKCTEEEIRESLVDFLELEDGKIVD